MAGEFFFYDERFVNISAIAHVEFLTDRASGEPVANVFFPGDSKPSLEVRGYSADQLRRILYVRDCS